MCPISSKCPTNFVSASFIPTGHSAWLALHLCVGFINTEILADHSSGQIRLYARLCNSI